jgi:hypothetical protein
MRLRDQTVLKADNPLRIVGLTDRNAEGVVMVKNLIGSIRNTGSASSMEVRAGHGP